MYRISLIIIQWQGILPPTDSNGLIVYAENQQGNNSLDTLDERDSTEIVWTFRPKAEYTFLSSAHGTFSRTDHIMAHKSALNRYNRYKKVDITPCTFSDHDSMKLEVDSKKKIWTDQKYMEIMNILLENEWSNQEIKEEI